MIIPFAVVGRAALRAVDPHERRRLERRLRGKATEPILSQGYAANFIKVDTQPVRSQFMYHSESLSDDLSTGGATSPRPLTAARATALRQGQSRTGEQSCLFTTHSREVFDEEVVVKSRFRDERVAC